MSGRDRRGLEGVGTCSEWSALCRELFDEVGLVWERVLRFRLSDGTCSERSA